LLETGYPFVFYDFKKISESLNNSKFILKISNAKKNQEFFAANEVKYNLNDSILLVKANENILSIAGIIEHSDFLYSETTNSLLIEGSIFNASKIRQQSRHLGLRTERSARYEKSLRNTYLIESFYRLISLLRIFNPNLTCKLHTIAKASEKIRQPILLRYQTVNEILGPIEVSNEKNLNYINREIIESYLNRLNIKFFYDKLKLAWEVNIPHSRMDDLTREIDLIEEIARLHGFNNFLIRLPQINQIGNEDLTYQTRKKITSCFLNLGLNELIHYSLVNQKTFQNNQVKLINPLLYEYSYLRLSLLPNLIKTLEENLKQGNQFIEGFEYGHVFYEDSNKKLCEKEHVAGIFGGLKTKLTWSDSEKTLSWFEAKGKIEQFFKQLNILPEWKKSSKKDNLDILHPYRSASLYLKTNIEVGIFGQIHPILSNHLDIPVEIYLFEFDLEAIQNQIARNQITIFNDYSLYPKIIKNLSFIIEKKISYKELHETLYLNGTEFLSEVNLLDEYTGPSIPEDHISLCLELVFQSNKKTLENKEIENIISKFQSILSKKFKAIIRN
jgi:phenylalanyl-tRNA synthetase beta chain